MHEGFELFHMSDSKVSCILYVPHKKLSVVYEYLVMQRNYNNTVTKTLTTL